MDDVYLIRMGEHMCSYLSRHLSSCCWPCMHHVQAILICFISIYLLWHCKLISPRLLQLLCQAADVAVGHVRVAWHHSWGWCNQACVSFLWSASRPKLPAKTPFSLCELLVQRHTGPIWRPRSARTELEHKVITKLRLVPNIYLRRFLVLI